MMTKSQSQITAKMMIEEFKDLHSFRKELRDLLATFRRKACQVKIKETIGVSSFGGGLLKDYDPKIHWHDDQVEVVLEFEATALDGYPIQPYDRSYSQLFLSIAPTREVAFSDALSKVRATSEKWRLAIEEDDRFALSIGKQVKILKKIGCSLHPNLIGKIVRHSPAFVYVDFGMGQVPIATSYFRSGFLRTTDIDTGETKPNWSPNTKLVSVLDPYISFTDGSQPWRPIWEAEKKV